MHTQACNRHTYSYTRTNTDVDNKHTLVHCLDLTSGIDAVWSIALAPLTSHAPATVKKMPVAQMEVWKAIKKLLALTAKCLQVYIRVLPELSPVFLVTHCFPAEVFLFLILCSVFSRSILLHAKPFTATAQGCIHQSSQGTTANWFPNRISLLPAISLHYDFS